MRVLHVTPTYRPAIGGIESVIENLCRELDRLGVVSEVAHVSPGLRERCESVKEIRVWRVPLIGHPFVGFAPGLRKIVGNYDILHVHDPQLLAITANIAVFGGRNPAVLSTHGGFHHTKRFPRLKRLHELLLMRPLLRRYRLILASSEADNVSFSDFAEHVRLCENGVDITRFAAVSASPNRSLWDWLYWGRLSRNKRLDSVVALSRQARALGAPITLTLCGIDFDGSGAELRAACEAAEEDWVIFEPPADDDRLAEIISRSSVYVTASQHEGFGLSVIEALAAGLPVVCRDIRPLKDFVDNSCGLVLDFDNGESDAARLSGFLAELRERHTMLSLASRDRAKRFDWPQAAQGFLKYYQEALTTGPSHY